MNKLKIVFGTLVLIMLTSCKNEEEIKILNTNIDIETLHGSIQFPVIAKLAGNIIVIDSLLLVHTPFNKDGIFSVVSKKNGQVRCIFNKRGKGPDEYIQPQIELVGTNTISLWDVNNVFSEVLIGLNAENEITFELLNSLKISKPGFLVYRLDPELLISTIPDKGMFALYNNKGELVGDYFGRNPLRDKTQEYDRFQGTIAVSDSQYMFVFGTYDLGYLCAYDINNNQPILKWEFYLHQKPFYSLTNGRVQWGEKRHVQGIKDIQINNDWIFVLYSDRSISLPGNTPEGAFSDYLYLLNIEGEILKKYKLDVPVLKLIFSGIDAALYGITMTDDWQVVKFDFPDINNF